MKSYMPTSGRIGPQPVAQQADDQGYFYKTVAQQVESIKMSPADGKLGGELHQMAGEKILRVFERFFLREGTDQRGDGLGADKGEREPAKTFNQRVRAFQERAELADLLNAALVEEACS